MLGNMVRPVAIAALIVVVVGACGGSDDGGDHGSSTPPSTDVTAASDRSTSTSSLRGSTAADDGVPHVIGVVAVESGDGTYAFEVTISSPYDGPDKYADAWRVVTSDGEVLATRELTHHHAGEQPFTRSLSGIDVSSGAVVWVEARDLVEGWSGELFEVELDD